MTSGNPTLDKNLECIGKYNPQLKDKLLNLPFLTNKIELIETELKEPNLLYNELPLHNQKGAEAEAKNLFKQATGNPPGINLIYGMGLGYLFKEFSGIPKGSIIVYEPNLEILRVTLELVDFSKELSKQNIKIVSDVQELKIAFASFYQYKMEAYFLYLDSYKELYEKEMSFLIRQVEKLKQFIQEDIDMLRNRGFTFATSVLTNLAIGLDSELLGKYKDSYKGKTAIIVAAGPTLDLNVETIKKNREKAVIFCVGTALKSLAKNGIIPDFVVISETINCSAQINGVDISDRYLIVSPYTHSLIQNAKVKNKFLFPPSNTMGGKYWAHITGIDISEYVAKGSVSHTAISSAKMLGFNKLILVGQDLALVNNSKYSKDSPYSNMVLEQNPETKKFEYTFKGRENFKRFINAVLPGCKNLSMDHEKTLLKEFNNRLETVKGISGEPIPTDIGYKIFVDVFEEFASENKDLELINTSMIGAQIDGFKNIPLEKALGGAENIDKMDFPTKFKFDKHLVLKNLNGDRKNLEKALGYIKTAKEHCGRFEKEIKRRNSITENAEKDYITLLKIYDSLTVEFFEKTQIYKMITAKESLDIKYYADSTSDQGPTRIKNIYNLLKTYFYNIEDKISKIIKEIEAQEELLNESINTAG